MGMPRISRTIGAINVGSFRISAMILGVSEVGEMVVLGSGHRASAGIKDGFVTDMRAATFAIRDAVERAEKSSGVSVSSVWVGCSGAGLASMTHKVEVPIGGRRIQEDDVEDLLLSARDCIEPDGRMVLHAQPAYYTLDSANDVANPVGLHAEQLGVEIHVMLADGAPVRNLTEAVQNAHLHVQSIIAAPLAAGYACLSPEERDLGTALIEIGGDVTNVAVYSGGMLVGLETIRYGSGDITDAIASVLGIRRSQAERLKCVSGSAIASPTDHRELVCVSAPGDDGEGPIARGADDKNRIPRAAMVAVITEELGKLTDAISHSLKNMHFSGTHGGQVVLTGGGAELAGIAEFTQAALGRPVRIGKPPALRGLPEGHGTPGFSTLTGLCLYALEDPVDIRAAGSAYQKTVSYSGLGLFNRVIGAVKEYF
ncbi:MAG: cell division protein FtsA [Sphingomonadaceae bacterium]